jgi:hypothetical protein
MMSKSVGLPVIWIFTSKLQQHHDFQEKQKRAKLKRNSGDGTRLTNDRNKRLWRKEAAQ